MSTTFPAVQSVHVSMTALSQQPEVWQQKALGVIGFSTASASPAHAAMAELPYLGVAAGLLESTEHACEIWLSKGPVVHGRAGDLHYSHDGELLFGTIEIREPDAIAARAASDTPQSTSLQQAAESAYRQIFALLDQLGYPSLYRFWNYMADINDISQGLERYRQFNIGRQDAFIACRRQVSGQLPAACALGTSQGPLAIAFLAGRLPSRSIENPRQVSAYQYPEQYGPRSPTFSRAILLQQPRAEILLISGTASIVGHETLHSSDPAAQTQESLTNIAALIDEANRLLDKPAFDLKQAFYRIYVRHAAHMPQIRQALQRILGPDVKACYVKADICRSDLLVEIEANVELCDPSAGSALPA